MGYLSPSDKQIDYDKAVNLVAPVTYKDVRWGGHVETWSTKTKLHNSDILEYFGLKPYSAIHREYKAAKIIGDTLVVILPMGEGPTKRRVFAKCNHCHHLVCAGHLDQHLKSHRKA